MTRIAALLFFMQLLFSCNNVSRNKSESKDSVIFDPNTLNDDFETCKQIRGQLLYLPVYSNVPYQIDTLKFDMSAFVAIHNTDLYNNIRLSKVLYFDQKGRLVDDFLKEESISISPLSTKDFYIPYEDQSGTGANFLVEWHADSLVNEPLIEAVTLCVKPNNTVAILSHGRIMREKK
ncbi:MAG TPA: DUF3124 domain-containing protein [Bacteroidales bacterium]|nr:DUF3124 domain-containing protein [Bacteroidales bacterium]